MAFHFLKRNFISPLLEFIHDSRATGVMILITTICSMLLSNSPVGSSYIGLLEYRIGHSHYLPHSLTHWINDGLMALFFFQAGMEIKREMLIGELASFKKSILPAMGALGGMLVPAALFTMLNLHSVYANGWGIPMATDIAFSLGVASLLGKSVPLSLKIFLTALAIIDDLGAIVAIALFYTGTIQPFWLVTGLIIWVVLVIWNQRKLPFGIWNFIAGLLLWFCLYNSGIHATIAGVLFAITIPLQRLTHLEHALHHYINFLILPLFVLANTAIVIPDNTIELLSSGLSIGIIIGLFFGKPIGIVSFCWIAVQFKLGELAKNLNWKHMMGLGLLAAIGFTMSIFIALLAFPDVFSQTTSKMAVMAASLLAMLASVLWFRFTNRATPKSVRATEQDATLQS